jgi:hypothetical protein
MAADAERINAAAKNAARGCMVDLRYRFEGKAIGPIDILRKRVF